MRNTLKAPLTIRSAGMSLIELLVALSIGIIIMAGLGNAYLNARQNFRSMEALARMQEDARIAFEVMGKDIHMAGFTGCTSNFASLPPVNNALSTKTEWYQNYYTPSSTSQSLYYPLYGYENSNETSISFPSSAYSGFPVYSGGSTAVAGVNGNVYQGDVLSLKQADTTQQMMVKNITAASNTLTLNSSAYFPPGQILLSVKTDCTGMDMFISASTACSTAPCGSTQLVYTGTLQYTAANTNIVYPLSAVSYYISKGTDPALYRQVLSTNGTLSAQELVAGVQDMQITYAMDTSGDNQPDCYVLASDIPLTAGISSRSGTVNCPAPTNGAGNWQNVLGVRVSLLMVSAAAVNNVTSMPQIYQIDTNGDGNISSSGTTIESVTPTDNLMRKVFTATFKVKNHI